jgi:RHS repeat-associated protein
VVIASSWFDLVVGLDLHILLVPMPPAPAPVPTPLPLPFTGLVIDPIGAAFGKAMGGSTVLIGCLLATNCGTNVMNLPFHPPAPFPPATGKFGDDAELLFGSLNVEIAGSLGVRLGDIALSCNDPVRMPVSVVLAIPKGSLVLNMPAMVPDLKVIAMMLAFKAAGAALRWAQKGPLKGFFEGLSNKLKVNGSSRGRQLFNDLVCFLTGHPVDVATGRVITSQTDLELPGPLNLTFGRRYDSCASSRAPGPLGFGWAHPFDQAIWPERGAMVLRAEDGREIEFSTLDFPDRAIAPGRDIFVPHERLTLHAHAAMHFTVTDAKGTVREFARVPGGSNREARLVRVRNRLGQTQELQYDSEGLLSSVSDPAGRRLEFHYDRARRLAQVNAVGTDSAAVVVGVYRYDQSGDLIEAADALGHAYRYEYVEHLLVKETNKNGLSFYFQYDGVDATAKCVRTWGDGGVYDHLITYDAQGRRTVVENSLGFVTTYLINEAGQVVAIIDANGGKTQYDYEHSTYQKTKEIDPTGNETVSEYDLRGNLVRVVTPDGAELALEYDERDLLTRVVDPLGGQWRWRYDENSRLIARANPLLERTRFHWEGPQLVAVTDPQSQRTQLTYDAAQNLATLTTADQAASAWRHDGLGRVLAQIDANGNTRQLQRDPLGRVVATSEPDGNRRALTYDPEGNVTRAQDHQYDVGFEYRGMNRLAARTQAGTRVEFLYDTEDQLIAIKNEHGFAYRFVLGGTGTVQEEWGFDDLRRRYIRDSAGRVTLIARPEGKRTEYAYDKAGRVTAVKHSDGTSEAYAYRADGVLLQASNDTTSVAFERDPLGRIVKELTGDDWVSSEYNALGLRKTLRSSKGLSQKITRNSMGDVVGVEAESAGFSATFARDRLGLELERSLPGGIRARWERDSIGRPVRQEIWRGSEFQNAKQYVWDVNDRLTKVVDAMSGPVDYSHDGLGNLAAATYADGKVDLRMPDAVGNLFRSADRSDRKYGPAGQLLESRDARGVTTYGYDSEGNLTKKVEPDGAVWSYAWDGAGMLKRVVRPNGHVVEFGYDPLARRTFKKYRGKTTRWIWDGNVPLHEWVERDADAVDEDFVRAPQEDDAVAAGEKALKAMLSGRPANGPPLEQASAKSVAAASSTGTVDAPVTWLFEPESFAPLAKLVDGQRFGIVTDHLGTPRAMFDGDGREVWGADVDAYGDLRNQRGERQACPFRWAGQYEDEETELHYNRWRYYSPSAGGFTSRDPSGLTGGSRFYAFVHDTLRWSDPYGLEACIAARSRRDALDQAQGHAQVRRASKGGEPIPFDELNATSRGKNFNRLQAEGASDLGRRDPVTGAEFFDHPDGHPDQIGDAFPAHHASPHVHATNPKGDTVIITYPAAPP